MQSVIKTTVLAGLLFAAPAVVYAQFDFTVDGLPVQVHSFLSQGFAYSNDNNYLTMNTSAGSFAFTDLGMNVSSQLTDKFRVGAQMYVRNIGKLGDWHPTLDWAFGDYKFASWFGIRAGKVKTTLGLFNDTQDMEFLHTWAILPQSAYPLDLRASTIAHVGGDAYGTIGMKKLGELAYTAYGGSRPYDPYGGYYLGVEAEGISLTKDPGTQVGGDLRWNNLLQGLVFGASYLHTDDTGVLGTMALGYGMSMPVKLVAVDNTTAYYAEYKTDKLTLDGEYRREITAGTEGVGPLPPASFSLDARGWYVSAAYRIWKRLELGAYDSQFVPLWGEAHSPADNHIYDRVVAAKFDVTRFWDVKLEGHFIDGYGSPYSFRGFYPQDNPTGFKPTTDMLVIRTGVFF